MIRILVISCFVAVIAAQSVNYCSLCQGHIGCKARTQFGPACSSDRTQLDLKKKHKSLILGLHNRMRNQLALGKIGGYQSARRMPVLQWDNELAYLASLNARSCRYGHDTCRATQKYKRAGQNIARRGNSRSYENDDQAIERMIKDWFIEYKDAGMSYINAYRSHDQGKKIGHFTVMANENVSRVGCAVVKHQEGAFKYTYLVCNYSYTNIISETVYHTGRSCSGCKSGCHQVYKGLCSERERIIA